MSLKIDDISDWLANKPAISFPGSHEQRIDLETRCWEKKNHVTIPVEDMTLSHINHSVLMLIRGTWALRDPWIAVFINELILRKEDELAAKYLLMK